MVLPSPAILVFLTAMRVYHDTDPADSILSTSVIFSRVATKYATSSGERFLDHLACVRCSGWYHMWKFMFLTVSLYFENTLEQLVWIRIKATAARTRTICYVHCTIQQPQYVLLDYSIPSYIKILTDIINVLFAPIYSPMIWLSQWQILSVPQVYFHTYHRATTGNFFYTRGGTYTWR